MLRSFDNLFDRMVEDTFDRVFYDNAITLEDVEGAKKLHIDLPGVKKEDIKVDASNGTLRVVAERKGFIKRKFDKTYHLPVTQFNADSVSGEYIEGVLILTLPLATSKTKKTVDIK